jgi:hypothetical protein
MNNKKIVKNKDNEGRKIHKYVLFFPIFRKYKFLMKIKNKENINEQLGSVVSTWNTSNLNN